MDQPMGIQAAVDGMFPPYIAATVIPPCVARISGSLPTSFAIGVSVMPHRSSSRYQSALLRAKRETSIPSTMPTWPRAHFRGHAGDSGALHRSGAGKAEVFVNDDHLFLAKSLWPYMMSRSSAASGL
jgi:hypothetical protein